MKRMSLTLILPFFCIPVIIGAANQKAAAGTDVFLKEYQMVGEAKAVARMFIITMIHYPENKEECLRRFTIMLSQNQLQKGNVYNGLRPRRSFRFLLGRLEEKPYIARSYIQGPGPENGYRLPGKGEPWEIIIKPDPRGGTDPNRVKLFVECSGADSDRPISLVKAVENNRHVWKVAEASSLFVGIRPPAISCSRASRRTWKGTAPCARSGWKSEKKEAGASPRHRVRVAEPASFQYNQTCSAEMKPW